MDDRFVSVGTTGFEVDEVTPLGITSHLLEPWVLAEASFWNSPTESCTPGIGPDEQRVSFLRRMTVFVEKVSPANSCPSGEHRSDWG